ncbi:hypothetical protein vBLinoVEfB7_169 [Listeria phage vB_Lino_VEfB7]|nr:hypothetical protein vBLinoVEfB7_169 [Listeria phage vB_Lino_VEfB7]
MTRTNHTYSSKFIAENQGNVYRLHYAGEDYTKIIDDMSAIPHYDIDNIKNPQMKLSWSTGGEPIPEFIHKFQTNYMEPEKAQELNVMLSKVSELVSSQPPIYHFYGNTISVPRAIQGHPKSFKHRKKEVTPYISIFVAINVLYDVSVENHNKFIKNMLKVILILSKDHTVKVTLGKVSTSRGRIAVESFVLKEANQSFNLSRLWYPLSSIATYRVVLFEMLERHMTIEPKLSSYKGNYGFTIHSTEGIAEAVNLFEKYDYVVGYYETIGMTEKEIIERYFV